MWFQKKQSEPAIPARVDAPELLNTPVGIVDCDGNYHKLRAAKWTFYIKQNNLEVFDGSGSCVAVFCNFRSAVVQAAKVTEVVEPGN